MKASLIRHPLPISRLVIPDTGATYHITTHLASLTLPSKYTSDDKIHIGNGQGLPIQNVGKTILSTSFKTLQLNNIYAPHIQKNLLFVKQFTKENSCFFEFHNDFFAIKDKVTQKPILFCPTDPTSFSHHLQISMQTWSPTPQTSSNYCFSISFRL